MLGGGAVSWLRRSPLAGGGKIGAVRERAEENLRAARRKLDALENDLMIQTKAADKVTDQLVHENTWQAVAISGSVGFL